jgi:hypothetical protein
VSRAFTIISLMSVLAVVAAALSLRTDGEERPRSVPASPRLTDAFMTLLCRPPVDAETLEWDTKPFTQSELAASVRSTAEGVRVRAIRGVYLEVLFRDPVEDGCQELRRWVDRPTSVQDIARRLRRSPEARRAQQVRTVLAEAQGRDPGGWDSASVRRWARTGLSANEIRERRTAQRSLVGVHYFAWYRQNDGAWGNGATAVPRDTPRPSLGWYTSSDVAVMDTHIAQIERTGVDFVVLLVTEESPTSWTIAHTFLSRLEGRTLKVAVMLDGLYAASVSLSTASIERARAEFATHPNYFWLRGSPLVLLFSGRMDVAVPGITIRNVYWADRYDPGANTFNPDRLLYPRDWPFWSPTPLPVVNGMVPVTPGYSDTHLGRARAMEHPRNNGQMYHDQWQRALALRPEFIIVYSWNEHFERTAIEPTDAWQDQYLQWTACYVAYAHAGREGTCER